jgi:hypothetical protein
MDGIIRTPTAQEIGPGITENDGFIPIVGRKKTEEDLFNQRLGEEMTKATEKGLPFAEKACKDVIKDWKDDQKKAMGKLGYIPKELVSAPKIDWNKYSDLKNFVLLDEGERNDEHLTKRNPGLDVMVKKKVYQFKGYSNRYTVMEDGPSAVRRARIAAGK